VSGVPCKNGSEKGERYRDDKCRVYGENGRNTKGRIMTVSWFSAGVSSAVATKLMINEIDEIIYTHIDDQHPDTMRFLRDCEEWFGKKITILQSPLKSVENACRQASFIRIPRQAPKCSYLLKKRVRREWEIDRIDKTPLCYVWGMDINEANRCHGIETLMPKIKHRFPLIEKSYSKEMAHQMIKIAGIKRPAMYDEGYGNNNCIGCIMGGRGYWNKIRKDYPDVFKKRSELERLLDMSCITGCFLDELPLDSGNEPVTIDDDCGIFCELKEYQL
jgi:hypothetical protein